MITSKKRKVKFTNPETGIEENYSVLIWNPTIANLTLMALGSSAPEILLSCIETIQNLGNPPGELGPSTIVGSAAFNLLVISAISVVAPKRGETKKVYDLGVFAITALSSLFAYIWLYICLEVWSKGVVSIWEAVITFLFFVILILSAYAADRINWLIKKIKNRKMGKTTRSGQFDVDDFLFVLNTKPEDMPKDEQHLTKHEAIQKFYREHFGDRDPATLTREEIEEKLQPHDGVLERIKYRTQFGDMISGRHTNGISLAKNQKFLKEEKMAEQMQEEEWFKLNPLVGFRCLHYSVSEAIGTLRIHIVNKVVGEEFKVGIKTRDGTAVEEKDYTRVDEIMEFGKDDQD